jgi:glutathione S-transferase
MNATLPALEVTVGGETHLLTSSLAIAQYIAEIGGKSELLGKTPFERAQVDQWLNVLRLEVQPITRTVCYYTYGHVKTDVNEYNHVYGLLKEALKLANNHLKGKSYFVGGDLTIVDIFFLLIQAELQ